MNWAAVGWVTINCEASYAAAKVMGVIAGHVGIHPGDRTAHPSIATIARLAKVDEKTVRRAINALVKSDGLEWETNGGPPNAEGQRSNLYTVPERFSWEAIQEAMRSDGDIMPTEVGIEVESVLLEDTPTSGTTHPLADIMSGTTAEKPKRSRRRAFKPAEPQREQVATECNQCGNPFMTEPLYNGSLPIYCSATCQDAGLAALGIEPVDRSRLKRGVLT